MYSRQILFFKRMTRSWTWSCQILLPKKVEINYNKSKSTFWHSFVVLHLNKSRMGKCSTKHNALLRGATNCITVIFWMNSATKLLLPLNLWQKRMCHLARELWAQQIQCPGAWSEFGLFTLLVSLYIETMCKWQPLEIVLWTSCSH